MSNVWSDSAETGFGKRAGRPLVAAAGNPFPSSTSSPSSISIFERHSGRHFLVDSGADESVYPASTTDKCLSRTSHLLAANGSSINTYGRRRLPISFRTGHQTYHNFWVADVTRPILGASFFTNEGLLIDLQNQRLVSTSGTQFPAVASRKPGINGLRLPTSGPYEALLDSFPSLLTPNYTCLLYTSDAADE